MPSSWEITINSFDGLAPAVSANALTSVGNKSHASAMTSIDLTDPSVLKPGPGLSNLTNGTQAAAVTTAIKGIERVSSDGTNVYAVGGAKLYKIQSGTVVSDGTWPHTIDKGGVTGEDGSDVVTYQGYQYYSYDYATAGDVGRTASGSFDDDYISTVPTGAAALQGGVPHKMLVGGDDTLYIANGRYLASFDATTFIDQALDLPSGSVIVDFDWNHNRLYLGVNKPNVAGLNSEASVYIVDPGNMTSWEYQIRVRGLIGAVYAKNGQVFVTYYDPTSGLSRLAFVNGNSIQDVAFFNGGLPLFYQVSEANNHLLLLVDGTLWAWGAPENTLPTKLFKYASSGHATAGGISNAFGTPILASSSGSSYRLASLSSTDTAATWKSIVFDVCQARYKSQIERVVIYTEPVLTGGRLDATLTTDYGSSSVTCSPVTAVGKTKHVVLRDQFDLDNFRLDLSWANGSASAPVKVRKLIVTGSFSEDH